MKTIYELVGYYIDPKEDNGVIIPPSYPEFEVQEYRLGFYTSLEKSELAMKRDMQDREEWEDMVYCYRINEYLLDCERDNVYSRRSYLPNGGLMEANLTPESLGGDDDPPEFLGRTPDRIRFEKGDLVEVLFFGNSVELGIVYNTPPTVDIVQSMHWDNLDNGDDSYLLLSLKNEDYVELSREDFHPDDEFWKHFDSHSHPLCVDVFPPRFPVPEKLREILLKMNQS